MAQWIECDPVRWRYALRALLELRKRLYREHQVPPAEELHATKFVNGRSRIAPAGRDSDPEMWKTVVRSVAVRCLETIAGCPDIKVGAVYRRTTLRGRGYYEERGRAYLDLVTLWNSGHRAVDSHAFVSKDGNGTDPNYVNAHRALSLDDRHIIEDVPRLEAVSIGPDGRPGGVHDVHQLEPSPGERLRVGLERAAPVSEGRERWRASDLISPDNGKTRLSTSVGRVRGFSMTTSGPDVHHLLTELARTP